jgi:hypothetical protein
MSTLIEAQEKLANLQADLISKRVELEQAESTLSSYEDDPLAHFEDEITTAYDDMLNGSYGDIVDALPFYVGTAANLCEDQDNTFYRCGLDYFVDNYDVSGMEAYIELADDITELSDSVDELESEIEDLENEIEELQENN